MDPESRVGNDDAGLRAADRSKTLLLAITLECSLFGTLLSKSGCWWLRSVLAVPQLTTLAAAELLKPLDMPLRYREADTRREGERTGLSFGP